MKSYEIQKSFEANLIKLLTYIKEENFDRANQLLDNFYEKYKHQDSNLWLEKNYWNYKALILEEEKNYAKAIEVYRNLGKRDFLDNSEKIANKLALTNNYLLTNNITKAIKQLDICLETASKQSIPDLLGVFFKYSEISLKHNIEIPEKYRLLLLEVIDWWGISLSDKQKQKSSMFSLITLLMFLVKEAQKNYIALKNQFKNLTDDPLNKVKINLLNDYISETEVGYYKEKAKKEIELLKT